MVILQRLVIVVWATTLALLAEDWASSGFAACPTGCVSGTDICTSQNSYIHYAFVATADLNDPNASVNDRSSAPAPNNRTTFIMCNACPCGDPACKYSCPGTGQGCAQGAFAVTVVNSMCTPKPP